MTQKGDPIMQLDDRVRVNSKKSTTAASTV